MNIPAKSLHLYVHWPFCRRICPYCDFNVRRWREQDTASIAEALLADLTQEARLRDPECVLRAIHFGGGTPSMMPATIIEAVITCAHELFRTDEKIEIALEANPEDVASFPDIAAAGVNRLTLGAQSVENARLQVLGRAHSRADILDAVAAARVLFPSLAMDAIFATSAQSLDNWRGELSEILELPIDHLSLYGLTIEPNTAFGRRPPKALPDNDLEADMLLMNVDMTTAKGFRHYEVSNYAKEGHQSLYNSGVWQAEEYMGIGPGAHGRWQRDNARWAMRKLAPIGEWQKAMLDQACTGKDDKLWGLEQQEHLSPRSAVQEWLLMGMRLREGISLSVLPGFLPDSIQTDALRELLTTHPECIDLCTQGLLHYTPDRLHIPYQSWLLLDSLCVRIYHALEEHFDL